MVLIDFIASNPDVSAVRSHYDFLHISGDKYGLLTTDQDLRAFGTFEKHMKKRASKATICKAPRVTESQQLKACKLLKY